MEFRRKTKALSKVPIAVYFAFFLLLVVAYLAFSYSFKQEEMVVATDNDLPKEEILEEHDSLLNPDIYIPEATVIPIDTVKKEKLVVAEPQTEKEIIEKDIQKKESSKIDKKKAEELAKVDSKQQDEKEKITTIGKDRNLIAFIPGTMGKSGKLPSHNCTTKGELVMSFMVDKNGTVTSAGRSSGINDKCTTTAAVIWLKQYVKAKKSTTNSKGTYTIKF